MHQVCQAMHFYMNLHPNIQFLFTTAQVAKAEAVVIRSISINMNIYTIFNCMYVCMYNVCGLQYIFINVFI